VIIDPTSPSMGTIPSELEALESPANHSEWAEAQVVA
jgi:hypothetical protein